MTVLGWNNPDTVAPRGTLIVIPGRGEHAAVYERFGTRLAVDGYRVRAVADPIADNAAVLAEVTDLIADLDLPAPKVLVGSDGGALFAAAIVATGQVKVDALVLAGLPVPVIHRALLDDWDLELTERTACSTHQARLRADRDVRHGALAAPLPDVWFDQADLGAIGVPVLGLHGAGDLISPLDRVRARYATAPHVHLVSVAGGKHDALNDATHRVAAATVVLFLERLRLGPGLPVIVRTELETAP